MGKMLAWRHQNNAREHEISAGQIANALSGALAYNRGVFSMNPTLVEMETPDTRSLLERARAGEAEAFGEVCRAYETRLLRQAMMLCGNATLAEDLAQDTLVEAWKSLRRYNGRCQFFTWLCAILLNRHRNMARKKRPTPFSAISSHERDELKNRVESMAGDEILPDEASQQREQAALVWECIQALPMKHQQVVYLRFYADDSLEGIAAAAGCSVGTVKSRLFHPLDKLRGMNLMIGQCENLQTKAKDL
jgi:RNA polymerase sigma-70 factor (ECF subfamily)